MADMPHAGERTGESTRERILDEALRLFARDGYEAVPVSAIAGALGITKGALYRHYPGKRAIFEAIIERMVRLDHEAAGACGVPQEQSTAAEEASPDALRRFTLSQYRFWTQDDFAVRVRRMLCLEQFRSEEMNALYQSMLIGGPVAYVQALLEGMMRAGRLREGDAHALAVAYYAPMLLMILMSDDQTAAPEPAALLERHIDRFMEEHAI